MTDVQKLNELEAWDGFTDEEFKEQAGRELPRTTVLYDVDTRMYQAWYELDRQIERLTPPDWNSYKLGAEDYV